MADGSPAQQAAAGVLDDVVADEGQAAAAHQAQDADVFGAPAPLVAEPLIPGDVSDANEAPEGEQPQDELEVPEITWDTPDELKTYLEDPEYDEEEEVDEFEGEGNVAPTFDDDEAFADPEKQKLQRQIAKLQKKVAWAEDQKTKASIKGWREEGRKYFQFADVENIQATSRRAFLKEAQRQHEAAAKVVKPVWDQLADIKEKAKQEGLAAARAEAEARWGSPITGPQAAMNLEDTQRLERERLGRGRNLTSVIKDKFARGEVKL